MSKTVRSAWEKVCTARNQHRWKSSDMIYQLFSDVEPLFGDRHTQECASIYAGLAKLGSMPIAFIAQEKGRNLEERLASNFGMTTPAGFRKAHRLMLLAEKFSIPLITLIDTPGAACDVSAEQQNQSYCIATTLKTMAVLKTPIIALVIGEGMSGGGLSLAVADKLIMLDSSIFSVISPEGCSSILYKHSKKADVCAEKLKLGSQDLCAMGFVDEVCTIHDAYDATSLDVDALRVFLHQSMQTLCAQPIADVLGKRAEKWSLQGIKRY